MADDMPDMGNDRAAALRELQGQFGVHQNAEQLLQAHRARRDPAIAAASLKALDAKATDELDLTKIKVPDGHTVEAASVRGGQVLYVAFDPYGNHYKGIEPYEKGKQSGPVESVVDATARAYDSAAVEIREATVEQVAEVEAKVAEFRAKELEKLGKKLRDESEKTTEKTVADAEKEAKKAEKEASTTPAPSGPTEGTSGAKTKGASKESAKPKGDDKG